MINNIKLCITRGNKKIYETTELSKENLNESDDSIYEVQFTRRSRLVDNITLIDNKNNQCENLYFSDKKNIKLEDLFKFIIFEEKIKILNNSMYIYNEELGCFEYIEESKELIEINKFISDEIRAKLSPKFLADIAKKLKSEPTIQISDDDINVDKNFINCLNGVIDVETGEIIKHDKKYLFTYCIRARYINNEEDIKVDNFNEFINTSLENNQEKKKLLLEMMGYLISNYSDIKRAIVFLGKPHSGKSLLTKIISKLMGEKYISNIPLHKLGDRFSIAEFSNHRLNINAEMSSSKLCNLDIFKAITGGDYITGEYKGQSPFSFRCRIKLLFAGNYMPDLKDLEVGDAFTDRLAILLFNVTTPEDKRNYNLENLLIQEIDSIFTLAVRELRNLVNRNFEFTKVEDSQEFIKFYKNEQNHLQEFIEEKCILGEDYKVHTINIYSEYTKFCEENCLQAYNTKIFSEFLKGVPGIEHSRFRIGDDNRRGYKGIKIKN